MQHGRPPGVVCGKELDDAYFRKRGITIHKKYTPPETEE